MQSYNHGFIAINETWCKDESLSTLFQNYSCLQVKARQFNKYGRPSGGILTFYKTEYEKGIQRLYKDFDYATICKLDKEFFNLDRNIILICAYLPPEGSVAYTDGDESNGIELLHNKILEIQNDFYSDHLLIMGDLNARIGDRKDFINDGVNKIPNMDWYTESDFCIPRKSKDNSINNFGKSLIDLCTETDIHIFNGRMGSDKAGEFTNITENGCSVVDYIMGTSDIFEYISEFQVLNDMAVSNHRPLMCLVKTKGNEQFGTYEESVNTSKLPKFKWSIQGKEHFIQQLSDKQYMFRQMTEACQTHNNIDNAVHLLTTAIQSAGEAAQPLRTNTSRTNQPEWWDIDCQKAKRNKYMCLN